MSATASSGLAVTYSLISGPASLSGNTVTILGVGLITIRASQAGNSSYNPAPEVDQSFDALAGSQPSFGIQPQSVSVAAGNNAIFSASVTGSPAPSLQWQRWPSGGGTWSDLSNGGSYSGVTTTTLTVIGTTTGMSGDLFRCFATNSAGSATSNSATLTINSSSADITTGQVGRWAFDEGSGLAAEDSAGGNTGTLVNSPSWVAGRSSYALSFNGSSSHVSIPASSALEMGNSGVTIATWVRNEVSYTSEKMLLEHSVWGASNTYQLTTFGNSTLAFNFPSLQGNDGPLTTSFNFSDGAWHHVVAAFNDAGNSVSLYVDGTLRNSKTTNQSIGVAGPSPTYIGSRGGTSHFFPGQLDDVRIYNRALAPADVSELFNMEGGGGSPPSFATQPQSVSVTAGNNANFSVSVTGSPAPSLQWQRSSSGTGTWTDLSNGGSYSGVTTTILTVSGVTTGMSGDQFRCVITNSAGSATSNSATLAVSSATFAPTFTIHPQGQNVTAGTSANFTVEANGSPSPSFQWQRNESGSWTNLSDGSTYSGVTTSTLQISGTTTTMTGEQFRCIAANSSGSATSASADLTVTGGGGPNSYSLTVVNGTGSATELSAGTTRTIVAAVPAGALFTGWEISGPGTIPVSRLGTIRTLTMGAGNVTATATYQFPGTQPIWFDVNDDGIRDEVAPRGVLGFNYAIENIWTSYEDESDDWDIFFDWRDLWWPDGFSIDNFPNLWLNYRPSVITSATTWIDWFAVFDAEVGEEYRIMGWKGGDGYWGDYASITLGSGDNLHPTIDMPSLHAEEFLAFQFVRARISKPLGFVSIGGATTGVLGTSMGSGGVIEILLPTGGAIINVSDLANKVIKAGPEIVWEVWDAINNIKIGTGTTTLGGILNTANLGITTGGEWYVGFKFGELSMVWITLRAPQPILEPITLDGGIPPYNTSGLELGTQRTFRLRFAAFSSVADSAITWTATPGVSFVGGNNVGKTVVVQGDAPGISTLEVTIAEFGGPKPTVTTEVFSPTTVKLSPYVVRNDSGGSPAISAARIASLIAYANAVFKQAGIAFTMAPIDNIDTGSYLDISAGPVMNGENQYNEGIQLTSLKYGTGGLEIYFVNTIEGAAGLAISGGPNPNASGIILSSLSLTDKAFAHELGHACGWPDIYVTRKKANGDVDSELPTDRVKQAWLPDDWNSGPDARYYDNIRQRDLVARLLMHGHGDAMGDGAIAIPRGAVYGLPRSLGADPVKLNVGLKTMIRSPVHP